jgi:chaperonin cofactor prefoldin
MMLRRLEFFEKTQIESKWPDHSSLESVMAGMFERLKAVRDLNKKHLQRRAFIDLFKFMKDQGLKPNFQDRLQPLIIKSRLVNLQEEALQSRLESYFYKAQELLIITEASSQVEENSDLKNVDVIRIQGFSKSLMHKILTINLELAQLETMRKEFGNMLKLDDKVQIQAKAGQMLVITAAKSALFTELRDRFVQGRTNAISRINMILLLENAAGMGKLVTNLDGAGVSESGCAQLKIEIEAFIEELTRVRSEHPSSRRVKKVIDGSLELAEPLLRKLETEFGIVEANSESNESSALIMKRAKLLSKYVQLLYQDVYGHVSEFWQQQASE